MTSIGAGRPDKTFRNFAIFSAILGLLLASPIGQIIYVAGMVSVIGIPIAFLVEAIPTVALLVVIGFLLWRFIPPFGKWSPLPALATAAALLVLFPQVHNFQIRRHVADLTSGNVGPEFGPVDIPLQAGQTLALVSNEGRSSYCDVVCLHLLMSGQARRMLMVPLGDDAAEPRTDMPATSYTLERRDTCPEPGRRTGARPNSRDFRDRTEGTVSARYATLLDEGYCLVTAEATLAEADLALMAIDASDFPLPSTISPIDPGLRASRMGVYAPTKTGGIRPLWQQTAISYSLLKPILMTRIHVPAGLSGTRTEWWADRLKSGQPRFRNRAEFLFATGISLPAELL